jgi:hypothetical protein
MEDDTARRRRRMWYAAIGAFLLILIAVLVFAKPLWQRKFESGEVLNEKEREKVLTAIASTPNSVKAMAMPKSERMGLIKQVAATQNSARAGAPTNFNIEERMALTRVLQKE